jgi:hypothetical protein
LLFGQHIGSVVLVVVLVVVVKVIATRGDHVHLT